MRLRALLVAVLVLVLGAWTCAPTGGTSPGSGGSDVPISTTGLTALVAGEDWHYVGEAGEPAFQNSWANDSTFPKMAFRLREAGIVDIQGVPIGGSSGTTIFTLPSGYRPTSPVYYQAYGGTAAGGALIQVGSDGTVAATYSGSTTRIFINLQAFLDPPVAA